LKFRDPSPGSPGITAKEKDVSGKRRDKRTMAEKQKCERCGKDAIGLESMEGGFEYVCEDHADSLLLALKPGEKKVYGVCVLERFK
jgi:hypothetical protein